MTIETTSFCPACGNAAQIGARFCSACGRSLRHQNLLGQLLRMPRAGKLSLIGGFIVLFGGSFGLQQFIEHRSGLTKPTQSYQPPENPQSLPPGHPGGGQAPTAKVESAEIKALRESVEADPENLDKMRKYAAALGDVLRGEPGGSPELAFDAIDVLGRILSKEPNDAEATVMMADVSFDQKAFTKALDFYEKYLKLAPTDLGARARYASTLTFLGRFDDSISELNGIIAKDDHNFPATAYLAITYAQKGDISKAKEVAATALDIAPSDEARARFSSFVTSLGASEQSPQASAEPSLDTAASDIVAYITTSPIAGPKFVKAEQKDPTSLTLYFKDFPMKLMPPFAKEKFISGIRAKSGIALSKGLTTLHFVDAVTGEPLDTVSLKSE